MKVIKFGGTSLGTPENIEKVKAIVAEKKEGDHLVVVVSAFGGVTTQLNACSRLAEQDNASYKVILDDLIERHFPLFKNYWVLNLKVV